MKKQLFSLFLLLFITSVSGQYTLYNQETGNNINDGDIITVGPSIPPVTTHVIVTNNNSFPVKATLEATNIVNTDGSELTFCFGFNGQGNCYTSISTGTVYDSNLHGSSYLGPGQSSSSTDIDFTHVDDAANYSNYPKDYVLKITIINANDDSVVGSTTFTYRYDPNAQIINTFDKNEISVSTGYHVLNIVSDYHLKVSLYNLTGQKVKEITLNPSDNHIYTGNMAPGIYLVHIVSGEKELYKKIVIK